MCNVYFGVSATKKNSGSAKYHIGPMNVYIRTLRCELRISPTLTAYENL